MPSLADLEARLEALEALIAPTHQSVVYFDPLLNDPHELHAKLVAEGRCDPRYAVLFVPIMPSAEEWERQAIVQQRQLAQQTATLMRNNGASPCT